MSQLLSEIGLRLAKAGAAALLGLVLYAVGAPVGSWLGGPLALAPLLGGLQLMRWIHHGVMWLLLVFVVQHLYSSVLMSHAERDGTVDSIFTGFKFLPAKGHGQEHPR